jgi:hypothetical protein
MMCWGTNATTSSRPAVTVASTERRAMTAAVHPAPTVANAPIERRANIIGNVNVMASATRAYSDHALRMIRPATTAIAIHTANPAMTPRMSLAIPVSSRTIGDLAQAR